MIVLFFYVLQRLSDFNIIFFEHCRWKFGSYRDEKRFPSHISKLVCDKHHFLTYNDLASCSLFINFFEFLQTSKELSSKFPINSFSSKRDMPRILSIHHLNVIRSKMQTSASANCSSAIGSRLAALCANSGSWLNCRSIGDLIFTAFLTLLRHVSSVAASVIRVQKRHERRANAAKLYQI